MRKGRQQPTLQIGSEQADFQMHISDEGAIAAMLLCQHQGRMAAQPEAMVITGRQGLAAPAGPGWIPYPMNF